MRFTDYVPGSTLLITLTVSLLLSSACSGAAGTRPQDMSHDEHLVAAEQDQETANRHQIHADQALGQGDPSSVDYDLYQGIADSHREYAEAHRDAAQALADEELSVCSSLPDEGRESCPLAGAYPVLAAETIPDGARVVLDTADVEGVRASVECHRAHAAYLGFEGMPECPLYLRDANVDVQLNDEGKTEILLISPDEATVEQIRVQTVSGADSGS